MANSSHPVKSSISVIIIPYNRSLEVLTSCISVKAPTVLALSVAPNRIRIPARPSELLRCHAKGAFTDEAMKHRGTWNYHKPGTVEC